MKRERGEKERECVSLWPCMNASHAARLCDASCIVERHFAAEEELHRFRFVFQKSFPVH